jgi:hypothetical protein
MRGTQDKAKSSHTAHGNRAAPLPGDIPSEAASSETPGQGNGAATPDQPKLVPAPPRPKAEDQGNGLTPANVFDDLERARAKEETEVSYSERQISHIVVKRPDPHWFVRIHPTWEFEVIVHEHRENQGLIYYVLPDLEEEIGRFGRRTELRWGVTTTGTYFLWPLKLPGKTGDTNLWNSTAITCAARCAEPPDTQYYAIRSNRQSGGYELVKATKEHAEPVWLDLSVSDLLKLGFGDRVILDINHPILRRLREG